jgi:hypothetical protein
VLWDSLNDDDSDIRDVGATTVAYFSKQASAPLPASRWLAKSFLPRFFSSTKAFTLEVERRVNGSGSATAVRDDRLFAVESANLYADEARDRKTWTEVFEELPGRE